MQNTRERVEKKQYKKKKKRKERNPGKFTGRGRCSSTRRRYPGAEVTLYNNSFGFMSWVVYTLCVPRDNHEAMAESGSYFCRFSSLFTLFTTRRRRCLRCITQLVCVSTLHALTDTSKTCRVPVKI